MTPEVFNDVAEEFAMLTGNPKLRQYLADMNEHSRLLYAVARCRAAIMVLQFRDNPAYKPSMESLAHQIEILREHHNDFKWDLNDRSQMIKDIKAATNNISGFEIQLEILEQKIQKFINDNSGNEQQNETDFMAEISAVGRFLGFRISMKETTLMEYSGYITDIKRQPKPKVK